MKKITLKTLLVSALLGMSGNAWADYDGYRTKYTQDFEGDLDTYKTEWTINGDISAYSGSANGDVACDHYHKYKVCLLVIHHSGHLPKKNSSFGTSLFYFSCNCMEKKE